MLEIIFIICLIYALPLIISLFVLFMVWGYAFILFLRSPENKRSISKPL